MTWPQVLHALGVNPSDTDVADAIKKAEERRAAARFKAFDALCAAHGWEPASLQQFPPDNLAILLSDAGYPMTDRQQLPGWVAEYVAGSGSKHG